MGKRLLTLGWVLYAWCEPRETIVLHQINGKHPSIACEGTAILIASTTLVQEPSAALILGKPVHCHMLYGITKKIKMPSHWF